MKYSKSGTRKLRNSFTRKDTMNDKCIAMGDQCVKMKTVDGKDEGVHRAL